MYYYCKTQLRSLYIVDTVDIKVTALFNIIQCDNYVTGTLQYRRTPIIWLIIYKRQDHIEPMSMLSNYHI